MWRQLLWLVGGHNPYRYTSHSLKDMSAIQISLAEKIRRATSLLPKSHLNSLTELKEVVRMPKQRPDFRIRHSHKSLPLW